MTQMHKAKIANVLQKRVKLRVLIQAERALLASRDTVLRLFRTLPVAEPARRRARNCEGAKQQKNPSKSNIRTYRCASFKLMEGQSKVREQRATTNRVNEEVRERNHPR